MTALTASRGTHEKYKEEKWERNKFTLEYSNMPGRLFLFAIHVIANAAP